MRTQGPQKSRWARLLKVIEKIKALLHGETMNNPKLLLLDGAHLLPVLEKMKTLLSDCHGGLGDHELACKVAFEGLPPVPVTLIDCRSRRIVTKKNTSSPYAALSYVWGELKPLPTKIIHGSRDRQLPDKLAPVHEEAMEIALFLGINYLWIDQYCVEQNVNDVKNNQIQQMGQIYGSARVTIVSAVFQDNEARLMPNCEPREFLNKWDDKGDVDGPAMNPELPEVLEIIANSRWHTRGWAFQESFLSTQVLVVHPHGMYFECSEASYNGIYGPGIKDHFEITYESGSNAWMPSGPSMRYISRDYYAPALSWLGALVEAYSRRNLSFHSDAIDAFDAVLKLFDNRRATPVKCPTTSSWVEDHRYDKENDDRLISVQGLPFFLNGTPDGRDRGILVRLKASALCWQHAHGQPATTSDQSSESKAIERRSGFPSWSWAGWTGPICWTLPENDNGEEDDLFFCLRGLHFKESCSDLGFDNAVAEYDFEAAKELKCPRLFLETMCIEPDAFQLVEGSLHNEGSTGKKSIIKLMSYTLAWFEKPGTLYHSQGSQLDVETLYEELRLGRCRMALLYSHRSDCDRWEDEFHLQALLLRKFTGDKNDSVERCWYERVGGVHLEIPFRKDEELEAEEKEFLLWIEELVANPSYEILEIR